MKSKTPITEKNDVAIKVTNLSKTFRIPLESHSGLKQKLINNLKGRKGYREFTPLKDISFTIEKGDFFGIVGRNGSGKSTLLKSLAGIYTPNSGAIEVDGTLVPFIELGVGFNPELTGRENVFLNGALLGFSRKQMESMYDDIVDFAELHDFMEERLKNYSSGMQVRLAFSIAIRAEGDILLLDEVLAVGDQAFQQKCYEYFGDLRRKKKTVVLVTHDMGAVERFCSRAMLIDEGKIQVIGTSQEVARAYTEVFSSDQEKMLKKSNQKNVIEDKYKDSPLKVKAVRTVVSSKPVNVIASAERFEIEVEVESDLPEDTEGSIGVNLRNSAGQLMFATTTRNYEDKLFFKHGHQKIRFIIDNIFTNDTYTISIAVGMGDKYDGKLVFQATDVKKFQIKGFTKSVGSPTHPKIELLLS